MHGSSLGSTPTFASFPPTVCSCGIFPFHCRQDTPVTAFSGDSGAAPTAITFAAPAVPTFISFAPPAAAARLWIMVLFTPKALGSKV